MPANKRSNAMEIHKAVEALDDSYQEVMKIIAGFEQSDEEAALAEEIGVDIDRAIAKIRFYFTTLQSAGEAVRYALECEWGECPRL